MNSVREMTPIEKVDSEILLCKKCPLWESRENAVPGVGSVDSEVFFIGEAPGYWEDLRGFPFVGKAGRLLDELLSLANLKREEVFITNVVKCRPPGNRRPFKGEVEACTPYLDEQIRLIEPRLIVSLGNTATEYVFTKAGISFRGITRARGRSYETNILGLSLILRPTFHPAAGLRNPGYRSALIQDFKSLGSNPQSHK